MNYRSVTSSFYANFEEQEMPNKINSEGDHGWQGQVANA